MAMQYQQIWILRQTFEAPLQTDRDELMGDLRIYIYTHTMQESGAWPNMAKFHKKQQPGQKQHPNKWDEDLAKSSRIYPIHDAPSTWFNEPFSNSRHTFPRFCPCWSLKNNWLEEFRQTSSGVRVCCSCQPVNQQLFEDFLVQKNDQLLFQLRKDSWGVSKCTQTQSQSTPKRRL